jgi:PhoPQ-activated pathogenicity-related protein
MNLNIVFAKTALCFCLLVITHNSFSQRSDALASYINAADDSYQWKIDSAFTIPQGSYYEISLTSQTWHNIVWKHRLIVYLPRSAKNPNTMLLMLRHLENRVADIISLKTISDSTGTASAVLFGIPNQPMFDGKEEDDLQAYTFSQFTKTGDATWPLLLPMVKGVTRSMDMIQELSNQQNKPAITKFVLTGHSKRGHASWLSAAMDKRIKGIVPVAIDILNSPVQLPHHLESFGTYHTPSATTTEFLKEINSPRGKRLIQIIDPYSYRDQLSVAKLIVSATNDDYFATDALNIIGMV